MVKYWGESAIHNYDMKVEYDSGYELYIGFAEPGTKTSEAGWQIYKLSYDADNNVTERRYADGVDSLTKIWGSRTTYDYTP